MPLQKPTIVLLDMDGTTVRHLNPRVLHVLEFADDMMYRTKGLMAKLGKPFGFMKWFKRRPGGKKPKLLVHRTLHKIRRKPVEQIVEPCAGIVDLLELFKTCNLPVGIISNGLGAGYGHDILKTFDLESFFASTVFREDITKSKPDPEAILKSIERLKPDINAADVVWYIGDRPKDIATAYAAAKTLPCHVEAIGYGVNAAVAIFEHGLPMDHLILSYEDWYTTVKTLLETSPAIAENQVSVTRRIIAA